MRVDGWIDAGTEVTAYYDPMLAKVIARGATREARDRQPGRGASAIPHRRHRDQPRLPGVDTRTPGVRRGRTNHRHAAGSCAADREHRGAGGRHANYRAGLAGAPRIVGRRCTALGPHGRARAAPRQSHGGQRGRRRGARDDGHWCDAALRCRRGDRARRRQHGSDARWSRPYRSGNRCPWRAAACSRWAGSSAPANAPTSRCAAASTFPNISAAAPPSRSANSADMAAAACAPVTCCG